MGSRTKNAAKIKAGYGGSGHMRGIKLCSPIFNPKAHDKLEEESLLAAKPILEDRAKARREQKRARRLHGALPPAESVKPIPERKSAYTPPKDAGGDVKKEGA